MKKTYIFSAVIISLLFLADFVSAAVVIPNPLGGVNDFSALLLKIAGAVGILIGSLGTIMIIVAGILYMTSAGSPERINKAKTALTYAIAGIAIGVSATLIVQTILWIL